jgi:hypothetical protein
MKSRRWHLDEVFVKINEEQHCPRRAVDHGRRAGFRGRPGRGSRPMTAGSAAISRPSGMSGSGSTAFTFRPGWSRKPRVCRSFPGPRPRAARQESAVGRRFPAERARRLPGGRSRERARRWRELRLNIKARGLAGPPGFAAGDGSMGRGHDGHRSEGMPERRALDEVCPGPRHQRCRGERRPEIGPGDEFSLERAEPRTTRSPMS